MSVTLELNNHTNTAGVTLEQPVCPGNELCLARDGIRGDCPLLPVHVLHGEKPQGSELGFWGAPNSPHHGTTTALFTPTPPTAACVPHLQPQQRDSPRMEESLSPPGTHWEGKDRHLKTVEIFI